MSILVKSSDQFFEIGAEVLGACQISADEFAARSAGASVGEASLGWDEYADSVQIGCGCCMDKASYGASC